MGTAEVTKQRPTGSETTHSPEREGTTGTSNREQAKREAGEPARKGGGGMTKPGPRTAREPSGRQAGRQLWGT